MARNLRRGEKSSDAVAFKQEMQRRVAARASGAPESQRVRQRREEIESGALTAWWQSLPAGAVTRDAVREVPAAGPASG